MKRAVHIISTGIPVLVFVMFMTTLTQLAPRVEPQQAAPWLCIALSVSILCFYAAYRAWTGKGKQADWESRLWDSMIALAGGIYALGTTIIAAVRIW